MMLAVLGISIMVDPSANPSAQSAPLSEAEATALVTAMRRKEGNWVEWAEACQILQKGGWNPNQIFEATGFEPIQQNQILGAVQVYNSMLTAGLSAPAQAHFSYRASDVLYELRVLSPSDRVAASEFAFTRGMDMLDAREMAKAMKDFSRLPAVPEGFTSHPGDVLAYFAWFAAKQKSDLQARSGFIAKGLKFAHTETARKQIEQLLTDFTAAPAKRAPRMPVYRLDSDEELPRIIPLIGQLPLTPADLQAVPLVVPTEPFGMVQFPATVTAVPIPGWQVIRTATDPVVLLARNADLPTPLEGDDGLVLAIVDRAVRSWNADSYFVVAGSDGTLSIQWFEAESDVELLGKMILVMRPKKILDEGHTQELYQWDE
jgi:Rubisco Assembly chaperone C-terminal domain/Rubisco accumulation factor 1 alpha helical domain/Rubisco accumulation factor 1 helix turn helix domain